MILLLLLLLAMIASVESTLKATKIICTFRIPGSIRKYLILGRSTFA